VGRDWLLSQKSGPPLIQTGLEPGLASHNESITVFNGLLPSSSPGNVFEQERVVDKPRETIETVPGDFGAR
jgi:hypothetical protein